MLRALSSDEVLPTYKPGELLRKRHLTSASRNVLPSRSRIKLRSACTKVAARRNPTRSGGGSLRRLLGQDEAMARLDLRELLHRPVRLDGGPQGGRRRCSRSSRATSSAITLGAERRMATSEAGSDLDDGSTTGARAVVVAPLERRMTTSIAERASAGQPAAAARGHERPRTVGGQHRGALRAESTDRASGRRAARGAKALSLVLRSRGIGVQPERENQILSCSDPAMLAGWLQRAATISSAAEPLTG